jgi:ribosomal protein S17
MSEPMSSLSFIRRYISRKVKIRHNCTSIQKKGDKNIVTNCRPISSLTSVNKIFEKVMYNRLLKHLSDNSILSNHQFGFTVNQGTENAIFKLISGILNSLNQKMLVGGTFCDLEKAFDCFSHEILLNKLGYYGIKDKQYNLYKSYLQNRHLSHYQG